MHNHDKKTPGELHDERRAATRARFGSTISRLRLDLGLTQENLAERSGLAADTIKRLERGRGSPCFDTMGKLALGLGMRLSELFDKFELPQHE